jgi:hypothetical protein
MICREPADEFDHDLGTGSLKYIQQIVKQARDGTRTYSDPAPPRLRPSDSRAIVSPIADTFARPIWHAAGLVGQSRLAHAAKFAVKERSPKPAFKISDMPTDSEVVHVQCCSRLTETSIVAAALASLRWPS